VTCTIRASSDLVAAQAVWIAAAVRPLVMELDDRQVPGQERHRMENARAEHRMLPDHRELLVGQRAGLAQHLVGHADLADVVEPRTEAQDFELVLGQLEHASIATDTTLTRSEWPAVYGSRASSAAASARIAPV
jgi:hypothetical protein